MGRSSCSLGSCLRPQVFPGGAGVCWELEVMLLESQEMRKWKAALKHEGVDNFTIITQHLLCAEHAANLQPVM